MTAPIPRAPRWLLLGATCAVLALPGSLAGQEDDPSPYSDAALVAEVTAIRAGEPLTVALRLTMDPGWHSYWENPGDAGGPTLLTWDLPEGFDAGSIAWPYPHRIVAPPLASYGYADEVLLLTTVTPPAALPRGTPVTLQATADWVVCEDICLPAVADVALTLPVTDAVPAPDPRWAAPIAAARARLPVAHPSWELTAVGRTGGYTFEARAPRGWEGSLDGAHFFSRATSVIQHAAPQPVARDGRTLRIALTASEYAMGPAERLTGVLVAPPGEAFDGGEGRALAVDVPVLPAPAGTGAASLTLLVALAFALVGGTLLNLMPCVFPVLSLKVLGLIERGGEAPRTAAGHGAAFAAGVIAAFWGLAGALLALRAAGQQLGWGFQLQSPLMVAALAGLFFALGLNLLGVFEIGLTLTRFGEGSRGAVTTWDSFGGGVLAVVVATPCTAPFMGAALGFAVLRPPAETLLVFGTLGLGMALPYVVLTSAPALLRHLPRPGAWMAILRQGLAFPLLATVVWLAWVFGVQTSVDGLTQLLAGLLLLGLAVWILGRWPAPALSPRRRAVTRALAGVGLAAAVALAVRGAAAAPAEAGSEGWQPFSATHVAALRAEGRPVFVDFTAAWCLTCQVNERVVLASPDVEAAFARRNVALLRADWTRRDPDITLALERFGRNGVPLYVLYAPGAAEPVVLPVLLTKGTVLDALAELPVHADTTE